MNKQFTNLHNALQKSISLLRNSFSSLLQPTIFFLFITATIIVWVARDGQHTSILLILLIVYSLILYLFYSQLLKTNQALTKSELSLKRAQSISHLGSWEMDIATGKCVWSDQFFRICGYEPNTFEPTAELGFEIIHPDDRERANQAVQHSIDTGQEYKIKKRIVRPNGEIRYVYSQGVVIYNKKEQPDKLVGTFLDITDTIRAQQELQASQIQLSTLLDTIPDAVITANTAGLILTFNHAAEQLFGYTTQQVIGRNLHMLMPSPYHEEHDSYLTNYLQTGEEKVINSIREVVAKRADGSTFPIELSVSEAIINDEQIFTGVIRDITERRQAQKNIEAAKQEAERANRSKSDFLANMSHEIRTPLNAVIGLTELLLNTNLDSAQQDLSSTIYTSGRTLLELINDVLDFSKIEANQLELEEAPFDLYHIIHTAVHTLAHHAQQKKLEFNYQIHPTVPSTIVGDAVRLRQILLNLLSNAIKFTHQGHVTLNIDLQHSPNTEEYHLLINVTDTGIGITHEKQFLIFNPFNQGETNTTRQYGGTGLGLAITQQLINLMHGSIHVNSIPNQGSTFYISIPITIHDPAPPQYQQTNQPIFQNKQLLVISQNNTTPQLVSQKLNYWGATVTISPFSPDVINQTILAQQWHLILLDIPPQQLDSFLNQQLTYINKHIPIICLAHFDYILSNHTSQQTIIKLNKPINYQQLHQICHQLFTNTYETTTNISLPQFDTELAQKMPRNILIAEDNPINQKLARLILNRLGYTPQIVHNGQEALAAVQQHNYHLILMDMHMPQLDGITATKKIRELTTIQQPYIAAITANVTLEGRQLCLQAGMDAYIRKPFEIKDIVDLIHATNHMASQTPIPTTPNITHQHQIIVNKMALQDLQNSLDDIDGDLIQELVDEFITVTPPQLNAIRQAINNNDFQDAYITTHTLHSNAASFGAVALQQLMQQIQNHIQRENGAPIIDLLNQADNIFIATKQILSETNTDNT
ncbi:MAG TPA: PAS domain S-box protein [Anaerolineae bacterium]|nr:PAS domain S-box protein [Anaerolineae bacterium]